MTLTGWDALFHTLNVLEKYGHEPCDLPAGLILEQQIEFLGGADKYGGWEIRYWAGKGGRL